VELTSVAVPSAQVEVGKMPFLVVLSGPNASDLRELSYGEELVLGRDDACGLRIVDEGISRRHARILVDEHGTHIEDLGSRNGVFVASERVTLRTLEPGDVIQLGATTTIQFNLGTRLDIQYRRRLSEAAQRDPLTGVSNRRHFDDVLAAQISASVRHGSPMSLLVLDVDHFKRVNDTYGHAAGDAVLKSVAQAVLSTMRKEDFLARYGGEEFVVVSRETDIEGALSLGERIRAGVERTTTHHDRHALRVTVSIGVATLAPGMDGRTLFEQADRGVYEAKRTGRNRVVPG
jgi:diguanylate cyclase (GGDEF)-like protein